MKLLLLAVGKRHDASLAAAIADYTKRLERYGGATWQLLEAPRGKIDEQTQKRQESEAILALLRPDDAVVLLDERGQQLSSPELAQLLEAYQPQVKRVVFIIGGAYGVTDAVRQRANLIWALSRLVFPHQLVRLLLVEQLYRAYTIVKGEPYHHN